MAVWCSVRVFLRGPVVGVRHHHSAPCGQCKLTQDLPGESRMGYCCTSASRFSTVYLHWAPSLFQDCCYLLNTNCCESCSLGSEGMPLQDGTSGAGRCPCDPGGLVARNALARWLYALRQGTSRGSSSVPCPSLSCQITISCHPLLPHSALGFSRHIHVARTHKTWVCMVCQEHAGTLGSMVPMRNNCWCVLGHELRCW